jgi:glycosyltransferase involved in cell wall biosynthesis
MSKLKMLYSSNALWANSGYGVQGKSLLPRLAALPEFGGIQNIAMFAWYGLQGGIHDVGGLRCYPAGMDPYGNDIIEAHTKDFQANIVVSLIDVWVMKETAKKVAPALWIPWTPIDYDPIPEAVISSLQGAYLTLSYSKWGRDMMNKIGIENEYIPHGVETDIYRVLEDRQRIAAFREQIFGMSKDGHLSVMVAANKGYPDRKGFQQQLRAWRDFAADKPHAKIYIHTEPTQMYGGLELGKLIANLGIADKVLFPERYQYYKGMPPEYLALVYNSADVLLANSMSEGFGIPIIEAQACGTPVITTNFSAMPELVRWGYKIDPLDMLWTPMNAWQAWPDHTGITEALNELYGQWEANGGQWSIAKRLQTQTAIHQEYSWDSIVRDNWQPLITRLANEAPPLPNAQQPQAQAEVKQVATQHKSKRVQPVQPGEITVNGLQPEAVV